MLRFQITIFISAVLLFLVQPLIAKCILPAYGGTAAVWTTCMMFFQIILVAGYGYSHALRRFLRPKHAFFTHVLLLIAACATLPITPSISQGDHLTISIITTLLFSVGLPYFALSTTGSLVQAWHRAQQLAIASPDVAELSDATSHAQPSADRKSNSTYRLYALSNFGSLLALIGYPFLIEPWFSRASQISTWSIGFAVFAFACVWTGVSSLKLQQWESGVDSQHTAKNRMPIAPMKVMVWFLLAFCPSVALLATTNLMCQEIASVPFLWVLPLSLYLMSFMICFDRPRVYRRAVFGPLLLLSMVAGIGVVQAHIYVSIVLQVAALASVCFFVAMVCHGELERLKPPADQLTLFFLIVAVGGACGGIAVAVFAPMFFDSFIEFQLALLICLALMIGCPWLSAHSQQTNHKNSPPRSNLRYGLYSASGLLVAAIVLASLMFQVSAEFRPNEIFRGRNEYGIVRVTEADGYRKFISGQVDHGGQYVAEDKKNQPSGYYGESSGFAVAIKRMRELKSTTDDEAKSGINAAVIGMGIGAMLAWSEPQDSFTMFELNPLVIDVAQKYFSFVAENDTAIIAGDGRRALQRLRSSNRATELSFDIIAMDAFSSDSIPQHLLTKECFDLYLNCLANDGIIVVHITNRFVDLRPVILAAAEHYGLEVWLREDTDTSGDHGTVWLLLSRNESFAQTDWMQQLASPLPTMPRILWTDDRAALGPVTRWSTSIDVDDLKRSQQTAEPKK